MAPSDFSVRLQKGITGGFAPPTPSLIIIIDASNNNLSISIAKREDGTPDLAPSASKIIDFAEHEAVIDELHSILKGLPTEQPPGSEDIYRLDTSIAWQSDDIEWWNGGPQGCGGGESFVNADEEQRKNFMRAVEIIEEISGAK
ncbi:uncharacterized protein B0J16DRAFT_381842 [Fusarium flagelliforme]|uniref:Uncharacterized protein n=1 Tax=Fusarium flagelliforme TaxID=2675880 RepID=A0A395N2T6_9HYPO|nr:uncharacterized protein B0J16DRAFT_381842 [Fusarium flagelliforme]KAH7193972.1 hypothetical protein B0J16DRAFT_381842 [Fusarium flagelliforme]RFN54436.1 hypothetical protein FIE12Z_1224 [Fusarium flagelliforme]